MVKLLSPLLNFTQQSLNSDSVLQILFVVCWEFEMARATNNGTGWKKSVK